jgi:hypothetical protein
VAIIFVLEEDGEEEEDRWRSLLERRMDCQTHFIYPATPLIHPQILYICSKYTAKPYILRYREMSGILIFE